MQLLFIDQKGYKCLKRVLGCFILGTHSGLIMGRCSLIFPLKSEKNHELSWLYMKEKNEVMCPLGSTFSL